MHDNYRADKLRPKNGIFQLLRIMPLITNNSPQHSSAIPLKSWSTIHHQHREDKEEEVWKNNKYSTLPAWRQHNCNLHDALQGFWEEKKKVF